MFYLLKMVIFHGYVSHNQMVYIHIIAAIIIYNYTYYSHENRPFV